MGLATDIAEAILERVVRTLQEFDHNNSSVDDDGVFRRSRNGLAAIVHFESTPVPTPAGSSNEWELVHPYWIELCFAKAKEPADANRQFGDIITGLVEQALGHPTLSGAASNTIMRVTIGQASASDGQQLQNWWRVAVPIDVVQRKRFNILE